MNSFVFKILLIIILLIPVSSFAFISIYGGICEGKKTVAECEYANNRYMWGNRFDYVDSQVEIAISAIRKAILENNYKLIEQYLEYPIDFRIEDLSDPECELRRDAKHYEWVANNFKEFEKYFKEILRRGECNEEYIREYKCDKTYLSDASVIIGIVPGVRLKILCDKFISTKKNCRMGLPEDLNLCDNFIIKVDYIEKELFAR